MNLPFALSRDSWGRLELIDAEGRRFVGVEPVRAFPISDPERGVSLCDDAGREVAWIDELSTLPMAIRHLLEEELAAREFVPVLLKIKRISSDSAPSDWDVETDRGPTQFTLESDEQIRRVGPHRLLIADAAGLRYQIPDTRAMDSASKNWLDRYL